MIRLHESSNILGDFTRDFFARISFGLGIDTEVVTRCKRHGSFFRSRSDKVQIPLILPPGEALLDVALFLPSQRYDHAKLFVTFLLWRGKVAMSSKPKGILVPFGYDTHRCGQDDHTGLVLVPVATSINDSQSI